MSAADVAVQVKGVVVSEPASGCHDVLRDRNTPITLIDDVTGHCMFTSKLPKYALPFPTPKVDSVYIRPKNAGGGVISARFMVCFQRTQIRDTATWRYDYADGWVQIPADLLFVQNENWLCTYGIGESVFVVTQ